MLGICPLWTDRDLYSVNGWVFTLQGLIGIYRPGMGKDLSFVGGGYWWGGGGGYW